MASREWRKNPIAEKLVIWVVFSVVVTLAPFIFGFLQSVDRNQDFTFSAILGTGQLLLVSVAISAAALGELIIVDVSPRLVTVAVVGHRRDVYRNLVL